MFVRSKCFCSVGVQFRFVAVNTGTSLNLIIKLPAALGENCVGDHIMSLWLYPIEPPGVSSIKGLEFEAY